MFFPLKKFFNLPIRGVSSSDLDQPCKAAAACNAGNAMKIDSFQNVSPYTNKEVQSGPLRREEKELNLVMKPSQPSSKATNAEDLSKVLEKVEKHLEDTGLKTRLGDGGEKQRLQVEIYDPESKEVIRRFPPDEIIKLAESIEEMSGFVLDQNL